MMRYPDQTSGLPLLRINGQAGLRNAEIGILRDGKWLPGGNGLVQVLVMQGTGKVTREIWKWLCDG